MDDFAPFLSIAEIAGVFVGFGALMSLSRDRQEESLVALRVVISIGLVVLVAALIPVETIAVKSGDNLFRIDDLGGAIPRGLSSIRWAVR